MAVDLTPRKVPVFPNINDFSIAPISTKAGNGADLIARFNGLIVDIQAELDALASAASAEPIAPTIYPTDLHTLSGEIYVNSSTGNDATGTGASAAPYLTIAKGLSELKKKRINGTFNLYIDGTFTEPLNFEGIHALDPRNTEYAQLNVYLGNSITTVVNITPTSLINFGSNKNLLINITGDRLNLNTPIYAINVRVRFNGTITRTIVDFAYLNFLDSIVTLDSVTLNGAAANTKFFYGFNTQVTAKFLAITNVANDVFRLTGNSRLTLLSNITGTGNSRSISISDNTIVDLGNFTFASGSEIVESPAYVIRGFTKQPSNLRSYQLLIEAPAVKIYTVALSNPYAGRIKEITWKSEAGEATGEVRVNTLLVPLNSADILIDKSIRTPTTKFLLNGTGEIISFHILTITDATDIQLSIIIEAY